MNQIKVFRLLTNLLIFPAAYIALTVISTIFQAILVPFLLLIDFILACTVVYTITSYLFLKKTLLGQIKLQKSVKDLIKVNGIISIIFSIIMLLVFIILVLNATVLSRQFSLILEQNRAQFPAQLDKDFVIKAFWIFLIFISIYSSLLLVHIRICFKLLKKN